MDEGIVCLSRNERRALYAETVAYALLLFTLVLGIINYGISLRGFVSLSPMSEWVDAGRNLQRVRAGFLASPSDIDFRLRATELQYGTHDAPSQMTVEMKEDEKGVPEIRLMREKDVVKVGAYRLFFRGDEYQAFIMVMRGDFDFLPDAVYLTRKPDAPPEYPYEGALSLVATGAAGKLWFDPAREEFRVVLSMDGETVMDRPFAYGEGAREGEYLVAVKALGHSGRVDIWRRDFKYVLFGGLVALFLAVIARLIIPTELVFLWRKDGALFLYASGRRARAIVSRMETSQGQAG